MDNFKTGKLIKDARKKKGLTQEDIATKLNITNNSVSKWERGVNFPDKALLTDLGQLLDLTSDELIEGKRIEKYKNIKKKISIALIIILLIINFAVIGVLSYSCYRNYNKSRLYKVYVTNDEYEINGVLTINYDYSVLMINNIIYQGNDFGTNDEQKIKEIELIVKSNDDKHTDHYIEDNEILLSKSLNSKSIIIKEMNYDLNDTYLLIKYDDEVVELKINFDNYFSNNHIIN